MSGLGLMAAKTATERTPACVKTGATSYEAEQAVERLRRAGATARAVEADSALARGATPIEVFRELSQPAAPASSGFYRVGFWILLLLVLYLWFRSA